MKTVLLQYWEESREGEGCISDGCSLHLDSEYHNRYVNSIYSERVGDTVPSSYEKVVGDPIEVEISEVLLSEFVDGSLRLMEPSMNNLISLEEIKIIYEDEYDV